MDVTKFLIYLGLMALVTYLVRAIPLILIKKKVENKFVKSFLFYTPYAVLGSMTFPVIIYSTGNIYSGIVGSAVGILLAFKKKSMVFVAVCSCIAALAVNLILM